MLFMQEARAAGCHTSVEADRYLEQKRKREAEENTGRTKENAHVGPSGQGGFMASEATAKDTISRPAGQLTSNSIGDMDVMGFNGADLLSEAVSTSGLEFLLATYSKHCFIEIA